MAAASSLAEKFDPLGAHFDDPYPVYAEARENEPIFFSPRLGAWVITRYEDVRNCLRDSELFSSANALRPLGPVGERATEILHTAFPPVGGSILSDGAAQKPFRSVLTSTLSHRRIAALEPVLRARAEAIVDGLLPTGRADLVDDLGYPLALDTIAGIAGLDPEDLPIIREGSIGVSALSWSYLDDDAQVASANQLLAFQQVLLKHLEDRRLSPRDDGFTAIAAAFAPGTEPLEFMQTASMLLSAQELVLPGHTTSVGMIANAVLLLMRHRDQWDLLVERPELVSQAVEEVARFENPVQGFMRVLTGPATVAGVDLEPGAEVLLVFSSADRDEALCERAETFDITRPPTQHLGFAYGAHFCPGSGLGRMQVRVALEALVRRLPTLRLADDHPVVIRRDYTMRGPVALHVEWS